MKSTQSIARIVALVVVSGSSASAALIDLTTVNSSGTVNGALFKTTEIQPTGSGFIKSFVRLGQSGNNTTAEGYNASARPVMDDVNTSPTFTHDLVLSTVSVVNISGLDYYEFLLDINQKNSAGDSLLSLDKIEIYTRATALTTANTKLALTTGSTLRYNLDAGTDSTIKMDYNLNSGSGSGDMFAYIPKSLFGLQTDFVYLYSQFGATAPWIENDGFEEWAARNGTSRQVPDGGGTLALLGLALGGLGVVRRATSKS